MCIIYLSNRISDTFPSSTHTTSFFILRHAYHFVVVVIIISYYLLYCAYKVIYSTRSFIFDAVTVGWKVLHCPTVRSIMNTLSETPCKYQCICAINHVLEFVDDSVEFLPGAGDPRVPVWRFPENRYCTHYIVFGRRSLFNKKFNLILLNQQFYHHYYDDNVCVCCV